MENTSDRKGCPEELDEDRPDEIDPARREVLAKIGRFAYAAPAIALLAAPQRAQAGYGRGGYKSGWGYHRGGHKRGWGHGHKKHKHS